ncbi:MAG: ferrochelatase [Rubrobacteridae bacterium]|nr:ferrochelatase [Rubrobacteridae bacterium]
MSLKNNEQIGVMLMAFGGPESLDSVESFMEKLMKGRKPTPEIVARAKEKYRLIGGGSPLPAITKRQAQALEEKLNEIYSDGSTASEVMFKAFVGMRYWHPFIADTIDEMAASGIKKAYAISMSPHSSTVSTKAYEEEIKKVLSEKNDDITIELVGGMYKHPRFIDAVVENIKEALDRFSADEREDVQIIFSAHSLPMVYIEGGDPYVEEINETISEVLKKLPPVSSRLAFQSKGTMPGEWLGPLVEDVYQEIIKEGHKSVILVPIGFAADHVETLWDLDILHKQQAEELGLRCERAKALNDSPIFIEALASMIDKAFVR